MLKRSMAHLTEEMDEMHNRDDVAEANSQNNKASLWQEDPCGYLREWLPREIPISAALALEPLSWEKGILQFKVPLAVNRNHMDSGFGGSLYTAALLVCWSWLHLQLRALGVQEEIHIVIQKADVQYVKPLLQDGIAICQGVEPEAWARFLKSWQRYRKGRITLSSRIQSSHASGEIITTQFIGDFVVY